MRITRISHSAVVGTWRERERALRRLGASVILLSARSWNEGGREVHLTPEPGEQVTPVRTWGRHPALFLYDPRPIWRALGHPCDLLDIHEEPFALATAEILAIRRLRRRRPPYVLYSAQNLDKRYPVPFRWCERWALRHAAGMNVCNRRAGEITQRKGFPGLPSVIGLGLDRRLFSPAPNAPRPAGGEAVIVGYSGRLARHKGVHVLLDALSRDDRLTLRLAGDGPLREQLVEQAARLDITRRVQFLGPLTQEQLPDFYRSLDVLAVPSIATTTWTEQFGRVATEAMACGTPVVASGTGALPDVVHGAGLLVPPDDPDALTKALLSVGTQPHTASRLREAGLARAEEFDWDAVAAAQRDLYRAATHRPVPVAERVLDVVVVAYGTAGLLARALAPLRGKRVIVVDNSSSDDVRRVAEDAGARYLDAGHNGGFASGVNIGLRHTRAHADVLLLNPDARIAPEAVAALHRRLLADEALASIAPAQVDESGTPARVAWPFPHPAATWLEAVGLGRWHRGASFVIGSVMLLRAEALAQVGGFDERFFLYAEETDWAYRAHLLGWRHALAPDVRAEHSGEGTSSSSYVREAHFHAGQERYLRKHFGSAGWQFGRAGQFAGSLVRWGVLTGDRSAAARNRAHLYRRGPIRVEEQHLPERVTT